MEATMGGLIQTKGTQRLVNLFTSRFSTLSTTRGWTNNAGTNLFTAFNSGTLLSISNLFIAQNASTTSASSWPADMNDLLYPGATLSVTSVVNTSTFTFTMPGNQPFAIVGPAGGLAGSAVSSVEKGKAKRVQNNTTVSSVSVSGAVLTVHLSKPAPKLAIGDLVCFALGKHQRLVRRWRWYLENDLTPENGIAIRQAIHTALDDDNPYVTITFQTIEDTQQVVVTPLAKLDANDELSDDMVMNILLMTQSTTAPDKLDPQ